MILQVRREIRFGLVALALSGLSFIIGAGLRGPIDLADPSSLVRGAASNSYVAAWTMILAGGILQLYGFFGLYRYLTCRAPGRIAFLAFVLSTTGIALFLPLAAFLAVSGPVIANMYQQGDLGVIAVVAAQFTSGLGLALLAVEGAAYVLGAVLFAIAIWRDGRLPKWTGVLFALSVLLVAVPVTFATELLGAVILSISAGTIAWKGWLESTSGPDSGAG